MSHLLAAILLWALSVLSEMAARTLPAMLGRRGAFVARVASQTLVIWAAIELVCFFDAILPLFGLVGASSCAG